MNALDLIAAKRDGLPLSGEAVSFLVRAFTRGDLPDYQMSAFLMAVCLRGMDEAETASLTRAMLESGVRLSWDAPGEAGLRVGDKHSTGGVGDKTSFLVGPLAAACGVAVPMIAGRGLGHTGGTVDKLEAVPGLCAELPLARLTAQVREIGLAISGQTPEIAPADGRIYALRDVTCTVESIPLIAASIMSKKLAEGLQALVMDVKCGRGAFMREEERARELARTIARIGAAHGVAVTALVTAMDQPLGVAAGNAVEIEEACALLRGERPEGCEDVRALSLELAGHLVFGAGAALSVQEARAMAARALQSGRAFEIFCRMAAAQGGDAALLRRPGLLPQARERLLLRAPRAGFVTRCDALGLGKACVRLGAGRSVLGERVDPAAGIVLLAKEGDRVAAGEPLAELRASSPERLDAALPLAAEAYGVGEEMPVLGRLVRGVLSSLPGGGVSTRS